MNNKYEQKNKKHNDYLLFGACLLISTIMWYYHKRSVNDYQYYNSKKIIENKQSIDSLRDIINSVVIDTSSLDDTIYGENK